MRNPLAAAPGGMPPPEVGVVTVAPGDVGLVTELPGRLEASRVAQVRARAAGILQKRLFREGSDVKAGQPLFAIDPAPYAAAHASAQATLARAQANLTQATAQAERYKPLVEANAISKQDYANAVAAQKQAEADVAAGRAAVQTAQINLGYASVTAPISGRIGRALVTEGRAGRAGRGDTAGRDPADRPDVRQLHAVGLRGAEAAPRLRAGTADACRAARRRAGARACSRTAASIRSPGGCCSPT